MSYEYKELIEQAIIDDDRPLDWEEGFKELDEVYAQAAKADEYEKIKYRKHVNDYKAEAFDAILKAYDESLSREHMAYEVSHIIEIYQSGESYAKK